MSEDLKELQKRLAPKRKPAWERWDGETREQAFQFAKDYEGFLSGAKTEREVVTAAKNLAEDSGINGLETFVNRDKSIVLVRRGKADPTKGLRILMAHTDSPRLDLKISPLYEEENVAFFKTHYYGGVKKYQWPALPLALHGVIARKDGKTIPVKIGEKESEPVFMITDLLPHLAEKQLDKKLKEAIEGEELNILAGSIPLANGNQDSDNDIKEKVKLGILKILHDEYEVTEEDFISAEIQAVPAGKARDLGFDKSLISAYGHDNRSCSYAALRAILGQSEKPAYTQVVLLSDREEIGSYGATGMQSNYFYDLVSKIVDQDDRATREVLKNSQAISGDVTSALDPDYKDAHDVNTAARIGFGVALERYTGAGGKYSTSEATAEYAAWVRNVLDEAGVPWQPATLGKVDLGGGGTLAMHLAEFNMDVIDMGPPLLNMHAPFEIVSKADLYSTYLAYRAFLQGNQA